MSGLLSADQLKSETASDAPSLPCGANGVGSDPVWVIAHALGEAATSGRGVALMIQVCRGWSDYVLTIKNELYGAILPRTFPRSKCIGMVLEPSKLQTSLSKEEIYRRHLQAELALYPRQEEEWSDLRGRPLLDPEMACTIELWLGSEPVLFAALKPNAENQAAEDCSGLTSLLKEMHTKEEEFLKDIVEGHAQSNLRTEDLATMYDAMNRHCGWDKLSAMIHVSNGEQIVRVYRTAFVGFFHDKYLFGNELENPKLILTQDGLIGMPLTEDETLDDVLEVGSIVMSSCNGERVRVQGLKSASQHNGKEGTATEYLTESGRFKVVLDSGEVISVRNDNLRLATSLANLTLSDKEKIMFFKSGNFDNPMMIAEMLANLPNMTGPDFQPPFGPPLGEH